jgi:hypothetical protein
LSLSVKTHMCVIPVGNVGKLPSILFPATSLQTVLFECKHICKQHNTNKTNDLQMNQTQRQSRQCPLDCIVCQTSIVSEHKIISNVRQFVQQQAKFSPYRCTNLVSNETIVEIVPLNRFVPSNSLVGVNRSIEM